MKKYNVSKELYTFKNNGLNNISMGSMVVRPVFSYKNLNIELIKMKKSNEVGYFCESSEEEDETIDFFYIVSGSINFTKRNKTLQKSDGFSLSNKAKDTDYVVLDNLEILHISFEDQEQFFEMIEGIEMLSETGQKCLEKDEYTNGHNYRVCTYAKDIARKLDLSADDIVAIGVASLHHDVGKVEIEDEVLFKQGKLTDEEFEHIQNHTKYGYEMTKDYPHKNIPLMIKQHHERLDGTGYPEGVKGDELLYGSQIISVADIYDALVTERPYKKAFVPGVALEILYENADKHYKKEIIDALKEILIEKELL